MGLAVDTVGFSAKAAGATGKTASVASGDSFTIRNFSTGTAKLVGLFRETATEGFVQLVSPRLANSTTGIKVRAVQSPAARLLPPYSLQTLFSGDVLTVKLSGKGATGITAGGFQVYYSTLNGASARLHMWGDIANNVANVFTQTVAAAKGAAGAWHTALTNATADLMQADTTYALLGYSVDAAIGMVALKAQETGNLRVAGPGVTDTNVTSAYFVEKSNTLGLPCIPVVNANNRGNVHLSVLANAATVTTKVSLVWAQLTAAVTP